jgi:hypothetical protein
MMKLDAEEDARIDDDGTVHLRVSSGEVDGVLMDDDAVRTVKPGDEDYEVALRVARSLLS